MWINVTGFFKISSLDSPKPQYGIERAYFSYQTRRDSADGRLGFSSPLYTFHTVSASLISLYLHLSMGFRVFLMLLYVKGIY